MWWSCGLAVAKAMLLVYGAMALPVNSTAAQVKLGVKHAGRMPCAAISAGASAAYSALCAGLYQALILLKVTPEVLPASAAARPATICSGMPQLGGMHC
jgi:hypothetical protein